MPAYHTERRVRRYRVRLHALLLALAGCRSGSWRECLYWRRGLGVECAPFARALTGVTAVGRRGRLVGRSGWADYTRSQTPEIGSLLILRRSGRLPSGHVAVVSQVLSRRQILVTQANWVHHRVTRTNRYRCIRQRRLEHGAGLVAAVRADRNVRITAHSASSGLITRLATTTIIAATPAAIRVAEAGR